MKNKKNGLCAKCIEALDKISPKTVFCQICENCSVQDAGRYLENNGKTIQMSGECDICGNHTLECECIHKEAKMDTQKLEVGDILQISPTYDRFGGMLLVVTDPKEWGAQGYLMACYNFDAVRYAEKAYLRVKFEDMEYVGRLKWMPLEWSPKDLFQKNEEGDQ